MTGYEVILFDLDGTLVDSRPGIVRAVQFALARFGIAVDDLESLTPFVGPPLVQSFQRYSGFDEQQARTALAYYREYYDARGMNEVDVFPGIPQMLERLSALGKRLIVATSKPTFYAEPILERCHLRRYIEAVQGSELDLSNADKATIIALVLAALGDVDRAKIVMVGDREHDILGARANGIASIGAAYGYGTSDELTAAGATHLVGSVQELGNLLADTEGD